MPCRHPPARPRRLAGRRPWALALCVLAASCTNDDADLVDDFLDPVPPGAEVSLSQHVQPLFTVRCAVSGCHDSGTAESGMTLEEGRLFDAGTGIVGVASLQSPLLRVQPFDSQASYLIRKLEGTQGNVGGEGEQMPLGETPLDDEIVQTIRDWIDAGALDN